MSTISSTIETHVIAMIVEQFRKPARFLAAAPRAAASGQDDRPPPSRQIERGARIRRNAHRGDGGRLAGHAAMVERAGVVLVETLEELGDVAEMLLRLPRGRAAGAAVGVRIRRL